MRCMCKR